jgi:hypothetical protein
MRTFAAKDDKSPVPPELPSGKAAATRPAEAAEMFVLTPVNKDLAVAVKRVRVGMVGGAVVTGKKPSRLAYCEIVTAQDDVTRYWFFDGKVNAALPADEFRPEGGT